LRHRERSLNELIGSHAVEGSADRSSEKDGDAKMTRAALVFFAFILCSFGSSARAETIDVSDNHGGSVAEYDARWSELGRRGVNVRIVGPCQSACTVLLGHIPRARICVTAAASFGFHLAHRSDATATLVRGYAPDIMAWINAHGGLTNNFIWMRTPDVYRYFHKC
jgi:hypothetical protein